MPLAYTGLRRGEALALRRRDVDLDVGRLSVRRSVGVLKKKGDGEDLLEGPTKTGRSRVVDLDAGTVAALRAYRAARGALALDLVRDAALVLSNLDGTYRHPERLSRRFVSHAAQARKVLGAEVLPAIRLHDLRHTDATLLLAEGTAVKVVSERLGHANPTITLTVYQHVHPGMGREADQRFAALIGADRPSRRRGAKYHVGITRAVSARSGHRRGSLTCRNTGARWCPRGDTLHTHTRVTGLELRS